MLTLNVDVLAGTSFREAVAEAKELCIKLSVAFVDFNFNGIKISVREDTNIESHVNAYVNRNTKTDHII